MIAPLEMRRLAYVGYVVVAGRKHSQDVLQAMRRSRMMGLPPNMSARTVIRPIRSASAVMFFSLGSCSGRYAFSLNLWYGQQPWRAGGHAVERGGGCAQGRAALRMAMSGAVRP